MTRLFWLTNLALAWSISVRAQQASEATDSTMDTPRVQGKSSTVVFADFSGAVKDFNKVWLEWDADSAEQGDYFVVERSSDGMHFETIDALRRAGGNGHYE